MILEGFFFPPELFPDPLVSVSAGVVSPSLRVDFHTPQEKANFCEMELLSVSLLALFGECEYLVATLLAPVTHLGAQSPFWGHNLLFEGSSGSWIPKNPGAAP